MNAGIAWFACRNLGSHKSYAEPASDFELTTARVGCSDFATTQRWPHAPGRSGKRSGVRDANANVSASVSVSVSVNRVAGRGG